MGTKRFELPRFFLFKMKCSMEYTFHEKGSKFKWNFLYFEFGCLIGRFFSDARCHKYYWIGLKVVFNKAHWNLLSEVFFVFFFKNIYSLFFFSSKYIANWTWTLLLAWLMSLSKLGATNVAGSCPLQILCLYINFDLEAFLLWQFSYSTLACTLASLDFTAEHEQLESVVLLVFGSLC